MNNEELAENSLELFTGSADLLLAHRGLPPIATIAGYVVKDAFFTAMYFKRESFNRKLETFIKETRNTSDHERIEFLQRLGDDAQSFQQRLLLIFERLDEEKKTPIISKLCHALILRNIETDTFYRLSQVIEKAYYDDLDFFYLRYQHTVLDRKTRPFQEDSEFDPNTESAPMVSNLVNVGLLEAQRTGIQLGGSNSVVAHSPTFLGTVLLKYGY